MAHSAIRILYLAPNGLLARPPGDISPCRHFPFIVDCFCGEGPPLGDDKRERCNTACEDPSSNDACGGESYLALYGIPVPGTVPEPVSNLQLVVDGASDLLGCYPFSDNYVLLTDGPFTKWGKMTNEVRLG